MNYQHLIKNLSSKRGRFIIIINARHEEEDEETNQEIHFGQTNSSTMRVNEEEEERLAINLIIVCKSLFSLLRSSNPIYSSASAARVKFN